MRYVREGVHILLASPHHPNVCGVAVLTTLDCCVICVQEFRTNMQAAYERCGFMGERVIGFAYRMVRLHSAR